MACRAEEEAAEQRRADLASQLQRRKASKKAGLQAEPIAGTPDTAAVRIRLPDGSTAQRRFLADQSLQVQCASLILSSCRLPGFADLRVMCCGLLLATHMGVVLPATHVFNANPRAATLILLYCKGHAVYHEM